MELTAGIGDLGLLANNGIVSLAWISIRPWLVLRQATLIHRGESIELWLQP